MRTLNLNEVHYDTTTDNNATVLGLVSEELILQWANGSLNLIILGHTGTIHRVLHAMRVGMNTLFNTENHEYVITDEDEVVSIHVTNLQSKEITTYHFNYKLQVGTDDDRVVQFSEVDYTLDVLTKIDINAEDTTLLCLDLVDEVYVELDSITEDTVALVAVNGAKFPDTIDMQWCLDTKAAQNSGPTQFYLLTLNEVLATIAGY